MKTSSLASTPPALACTVLYKETEVHALLKLHAEDIPASRSCGPRDVVGVVQIHLTLHMLTFQ